MEGLKGVRLRLLLISLAVPSLSVIIHSPAALGQYSDIVSLFQVIYVGGERWFEGYDPPGLPYLDYGFEYPPLVALLWALTTNAALRAAGDLYTASLIHFYLQSSLAWASYVAYCLALYRIWLLLGLPPRALYPALISPSMVYFLAYNWDIHAIALALIALYALVRGRPAASGVMVYLAASSKAYPGLILPAMALYAYKNWGYRAALKLLLAFAGASAATLAALAYLAPEGLAYMVRHHSGWYCENCFWALLTSDIWRGDLKALSSLLVAASPAAVLALKARGPFGERELVAASATTIALSISLSYVYSPQMNIMIMPLYLVAAGAAPLLLLQDTLNTTIMIAWFLNDELFCQTLGLGCRGPWFRDSPIQWIATLRILLLWAVISLTTLRPQAHAQTPKKSRPDTGTP